MSQRESGGLRIRRWILGGGVLAVVVVPVLVSLACPASRPPPVTLAKIAGPPAGAGERWYTERQVAQGREIFIRHCAVCHGEDAAATPDWRRPDAAGNYPPPPLNGSAHTWHHPLPVLRETIQQGGAPLGGVMPGFAGKLSEQETDAVIAWFQSLWSDEIYQAWYRIAEDSL